MPKESIEFKTEVTELLNLVIHSLYSNKEIFLRELISNSSDALDKLRFQSIQNEELLAEAGGELKLKIIPNKKSNTLTIQDNGIGMTKAELMNNIGTIAKSGTKEFMEKLKKSKEQDSANLIGQFGVGFYSAFMVADKIQIHTRKVGTKAGCFWESTGQGSYTIENLSKEFTGTEIILHLKEDAHDYMTEWKIKELVKKYSDFIEYPIVMDTEKEVEDEKKEKGKDSEVTKKKVITEETLNSQTALWMRPKSEIKEEEYTEFYHHIAHDFEKPLLHVHQHAEGTLEYKTLLFIPKKAPFDLFTPETKYGIHLYIRRVLIMTDCQELLPSYLRFVKGVMDSSDLPLNVSREILQDNPILSKMKKNITKKILNTLKDLKEKNIKEYKEFYAEFGRVLKEGIMDHEFKDTLLDLLLFESSSTKSLDTTSLQEYVSRMKPDQKEIYYITGENRDLVESSPYIEYFEKKGYEVLYLIDPIDEWLVQGLSEFDKKQFKAINKGNIETDKKTDSQKKEEEKKQKDFTSLIDFIKDNLKHEVKDVKVSNRLVESVSCLVAEENGMTAQMERLMKTMNKEFNENKKILEINLSHSLVKNMQKLIKKDSKDKRLKDYTKLIYNQALITEGSDIKDTKFLVQQLTDLMTKNLKNE